MFNLITLINVLSLFDGMSCGQVALDRLGIKYGKYFASEIDKYAIKVTQHNFPNTIQLGDVTQVFGKNLPKIDLLIGGSPCHGFSFAGKGLNFDDPRSKLFFEFVRLKKELKPKYFLLENVKMKKEYQETITELLGVSPIEINSSLVSAQNRKRLYWTNIPGDGDFTIGNFIEQPENKKIYLKDIIEKKRFEKKTYTQNKKIEKSITENGDLVFFERCFQIGDANMNTNYSAIKRVYSVQGKSPCLSTMQGGSRQPKIALNNEYYRMLTPLECERLQTLPDGYTDVKGISNTQRYKMIGNGWTVDVISHILKNMIRDFS